MTTTVKTLNEKDFIQEDFSLKALLNGEMSDYKDVPAIYMLGNFLDEVMSTMLFPVDKVFPAEVSFKQLKEYLGNFNLPLHLASANAENDITWQDIKGVLENVDQKEYAEQKCFILGNSIFFDFVDEADYMSMTEKLLNDSNANIFAKSHLIGMMAFAKSTEAVHKMFDDFIQTNNTTHQEVTAFPLIIAAASSEASSWVKQEELQKCIDGLACNSDDENCNMTLTLLQGAYDALSA